MTAATLKTPRSKAKINKPGAARTPSRGRTVVRDGNATSRAPRGGRRGNARCPRTISASRAQLATQALEAFTEGAQSDPEDLRGAFDVPRIYSGPYKSKPLSLSFLDHGHLECSPDAITVALNLMDFMLVEANWNSGLSHNRLAASCFLFASRIAGLANEAEEIVASFERETQANASAWTTWMATMDQSAASQFAMQTRAAQALRMSAEDVELGYEILWELKGRMRELVGRFAIQLESLQVPACYRQTEHRELGSGIDGQTNGQAEDVAVGVKDHVPAAEHAMSNSLSAGDNSDLVELDDFETSVEDFGS